MPRLKKRGDSSDDDKDEDYVYDGNISDREEEEQEGYKKKIPRRRQSKRNDLETVMVMQFKQEVEVPEDNEEYVLGLDSSDYWACEDGDEESGANYSTENEFKLQDWKMENHPEDRVRKRQSRADSVAENAERRRVNGRLRIQEKRAKMTPVEKEIAKEKDRIRARISRARQKGEELDIDVLTHPLGRTRSTKQKRVDMTPAEKEMVLEKDSVRVKEITPRIKGEDLFDLGWTSARNETIRSTKKRRADMTPAEKEMARERDRIRVREARARLKGEQRLIELKRAADAKRLRRKELKNEAYSVDITPNGIVIQGETYRERSLRIQRERKAQRRRELGPQPIEVRIKEKAQTRIVARLDKMLFTLDEKDMKRDVTKWRSKKMKEQELDSNEEDDLTWKVFFLYDMKLEFLTQRNRLVEEALEIELGPTVPVPLSPLSDPDWMSMVKSGKTHDTGNKTTAGSHAETESGSSDAATSEREAVRNRWKSVVDNDADNEESNAVFYAFTQVQVKIEADELNEEWNELCGNGAEDGCENQRNSEDNVADCRDWIARVMTEEQGNDEQINNSYNTTALNQHKNVAVASHSRSAKSKAAEKIQDIIHAPTLQEKGRMLGHWKSLAVKKAQEEKLDELHKMFLAARQCWIDKKPEDTEKRVKVDEDRIAIKDRVKIEKVNAVDNIIQDLIHKRVFFSQETQATREARILKYHESIADSIRETSEMYAKLGKMTQAEKDEKKKQKLQLTKNITREEAKKEHNAIAKVRFRMEKVEYSMHLALLAATGLPVPPPKFGPRLKKSEVGPGDKSTTVTATGAISVEDFENLFRVDMYCECIEYWDKKGNRMRTEVISYRKLLVEFLLARRKRIDFPLQSPPLSSVTVATPSECRFEWICLPESTSLQHIERFKDFITRYGEPVKEHLTNRRFYMSDRRLLVPLGPEESERFRIKCNERNRRRRMRKKYGIFLGEGEYLDKKTMSAVKKPPRTRRKKGDQGAEAEQNFSPPKRTRRKSNLPRKPRARKDKLTTKTRTTQIASATRGASINQYDANSNDEFADSGPAQQDDDHDSSDGWVPLGSFCEIDSVIRNDILNLGNQQQNFQYSQSQQQLSRSVQQSQSYQHFVQNQHHQISQMPHLQLADQFTNQGDPSYHSQMQWNPTARGIVEPLNYSLQFLPNSQINLVHSQQYSSSQSSNPQSYGWSPASSTSMINQTTPYSRNERQHLEEFYQHDVPTPTSSAAADTLSITSEDVEPHSSYYRQPTRGRPKGSTRSNANRKFGHNSSGLTRSLAEIESPYERNPEQLRDDMALVENISNLLPKCSLCDKVVDSDAALTSHIATYHPDPNQPTTTLNHTEEDAADLSSSKFKKSRIRKYKEYRKVKIACQVCSKHVEGPYTLVQHLFMRHFESKQYLCPFGRGTTGRCRTYKFERHKLRDHITRKHAEEAKTSWIMGINRVRAMGDKTKFWCLQCEKSYSSYSDLKDHCRGTHERIRYCCVHCGIYLRMEDLWTDHVKLFHPEKPMRDLPPPVEVEEQDLFRCTECDSEFSAQSFLDEHVNKGHSLVGKSDDTSKNRKSFSCQACDKRFRTEEHRNDHFKSCKNRSHECYWCKKKTVSKSLLQSHIEEFHPHEPPVPETPDYNYSHEPYKCEICKRSYMSLYALRFHCVNNHELYNYLQTLKEKNLIKSPQKQTEEPTEAVITNKPDPNSVDKPAPRKKHPGGRPPLNPITICCTICKTEKFSSNSAYWEHMHNDHGVPLNEHQKPSQVPRRELVQEDYDKLSSTTTVKTATGEMPIFTCRVCLSNFKTLQFLHAHIADIHQEDAFTRVLCTKCNCTFASKISLNQHDRFLHRENATRVLCPICNVALRRMDQIKTHMRRQHPGTPLIMSQVKKVPFEVSTEAANNFPCKICSRIYSTELGLKTHMTNKHFPSHWSTFCEICGLQMNPKTMNCHIERKHPKGHESLWRNKRRTRLSLVEIVELVHSLYEENGIDSVHRFSSSTKRKKSKRSKSSSKKSRRSDPDSEITDESDVSFEDDEEREGAVYSISSSDEGDDEQVNQSKHNSLLVKSVDRNRRVKTTKRKHKSEDSESDSAYTKSNKRRKRSRAGAGPAWKMVDMTVTDDEMNTESDSDDNAKFRRCRSRNVAIPPDSEDEPHHDEDTSSDSDFAPFAIKPVRPSRPTPLSISLGSSRYIKPSRVPTSRVLLE